MNDENKEGGVLDPNDVLYLIPDGRYRVRYESYETRLSFGRTPKVVLNLVVSTPGDAFGTPLQKFYNAKSLKGRPGRNGPFVAPLRGDLFRDVTRLFASVPRADRLAIPKHFGKQELEVVTRTVVTDSKGNELPEECRYSVADLIVGPAPALTPSASRALPRQTLPSPDPSPNLTQPTLDEIPF